MRICFLALFALSAGLPGQGASPGPAARSSLASVVTADAVTGKLVRKTVSRQEAAGGVKAKPSGKKAAKARAPSPPMVKDGQLPVIDVGKIIDETAARHEVDAALVRSVVRVESNYNPYAVSPKGAQGLMQLMPGTAKRFGVSNSFDPWQNVDGGVRYLKYLIGLYPDDLRLAIAAYNAGEKAVAKYQWIPPYTETVNYVESVGKKYQEAKGSEAQTTAQQNEQADANEDAHPPIEVVIDDQGRRHYRTQ